MAAQTDHACGHKPVNSWTQHSSGRTAESAQLNQRCINFRGCQHKPQVWLQLSWERQEQTTFVLCDQTTPYYGHHQMDTRVKQASCRVHVAKLLNYGQDTHLVYCASNTTLEDCFIFFFEDCFTCCMGLKLTTTCCVCVCVIGCWYVWDPDTDMGPVSNFT